VSFRYAAAGNDTYAEGLFGANTRYALNDNLNLTLNTEYSLSGIETNFAGNAGFEYTF
jgi:outer membrane autotransporter protein